MTTIDALTLVAAGTLKEAFFTEEANMYSAITRALGSDMDKKGFEKAEIKYQYTALALRKSVTNNAMHSSRLYNSLHATFNQYGVNRRQMAPNKNCFRITKFEATTSIIAKDLSLKLFYPDLKADIKNLKQMGRASHWRRSDVRFDTETMQALWLRYNDIKCRLMLLGYEEKRVAKLLSYALNHKGTRSTKIGQCFLTKQWMSEKFLIPLVMLNGDRVKVNAYIIIQQNANGGRRNATNRYEPTNMIIPVTTTDFTFNDSVTSGPPNVEYFWKENKMEDTFYYGSTMCGHSRSALEFLSPRSMEHEDVTLYNKNKGYRPTPYLGVELEVERNAGCIENITEPMLDSLGRDFVIFKYDGSLRGHNPIEIVTTPATLAYHKERWSKFMNDTALKSNLTSFRSGNCGMHIHISRDSFTGLHLAKFMRFINMSDNSKFIAKLAQRTGNRYSTFTDYDAPVHDDWGTPKHSDPVMNAAKRIHGGHTGHYDAVNTSNQHTVEVRIFRGNLGKTQFFKNLEFVHALWSYTMMCHLKELNYKDFLFWLFKPEQGHHKQYANLEKWLVASKLNVSNTPIRKTVTEKQKIKLLEKRKEVKKIHLVLSRKYKATEEMIGKETRADLLASA